MFSFKIFEIILIMEIDSSTVVIVVAVVEIDFTLQTEYRFL